MRAQTKPPDEPSPSPTDRAKKTKIWLELAWLVMRIVGWTVIAALAIVGLLQIGGM